MESPCPGLALGQPRDPVHYVISFHPLLPARTLYVPWFPCRHHAPFPVTPFSEIFTVLPSPLHFLSLAQPTHFHHFLPFPQVPVAFYSFLPASPSPSYLAGCSPAHTKNTDTFYFYFLKSTPLFSLYNVFLRRLALLEQIMVDWVAYKQQKPIFHSFGNSTSKIMAPA